MTDTEGFIKKCRNTSQWMQDNFIPYCEQNGITPQEALGGLCFFIAMITVATSGIGRNADHKAVEVLKKSFSMVRRRMRESGIMDPGTAFGAPGRKH